MFRGLLAIVVLVAVSQARTNAVFNMEGTVMGVEKYVVERVVSFFPFAHPFFRSDAVQASRARGSRCGIR